MKVKHHFFTLSVSVAMETTNYTWYSDVALIYVFVSVKQCILKCIIKTNIIIPITMPPKEVDSLLE